MNNKYDATYGKLIQTVLDEGEKVNDRTGVNTISSYNTFVDYGQTDLDAFPILTSKFVPFKTVLSELLWFLEGSTDERRLAEITHNKPREEIQDKTTIWTANAKADYWGKEDLGNIYGMMWRRTPYPIITERNVHGYKFNDVSVGYYDVLGETIERMKVKPHDRRHVITAWQPAMQTQDQAALPPCHHTFQFTVTPSMQLNLLVDMRSNDIMLGHPFNMTSYALLQTMVAQVCDFKLGKLSFVLGDAHIYTNHIEGASENWLRIKDMDLPSNPRLVVDPSIKHIDDFKKDSFELIDYKYLPKIAMPMAV